MNEKVFFMLGRKNGKSRTFVKLLMKELKACDCCSIKSYCDNTKRLFDTCIIFDEAYKQSVNEQYEISKKMMLGDLE